MDDLGYSPKPDWTHWEIVAVRWSFWHKLNKEDLFHHTWFYPRMHWPFLHECSCGFCFPTLVKLENWKSPLRSLIPTYKPFLLLILTYSWCQKNLIWSLRESHCIPFLQSWFCSAVIFINGINELSLSKFFCLDIILQDLRFVRKPEQNTKLELKTGTHFLAWIPLLWLKCPYSSFSRVVSVTLKAAFLCKKKEKVNKMYSSSNLGLLCFCLFLLNALLKIIRIRLN